MFNTTAFTVSGFTGGGSCGGGADSLYKDVFYQWTATLAGDYTFDTFGSSYDTKLSVHAGVGCAATCVGYNDDAQGLQSSVSVVGVNIGDTFLVQVGGYGTSAGNALLNIGIYMDPCAGTVDDSYEQNDFCSEATPIANGSFPGLYVAKLDTDNYAVCVDPGGMLLVDINFLNSQADVDLYLWDAASLNCGTAGSGSLASSTTNGSTESIAWLNSTGSPMDVVIQVAVYINSQGSCADYDMFVSGVGACGGPYVLAPFCDPMVPNSTGLPTHLDGSLNPGVASGVHLEASQGPPNQFGYFLVGTGSNDPGIVSGQGRLCLAIAGGNTIGQYHIPANGMSSIGRFDGSGIFQNIVGTSQVGTGYDIPVTLPNPVGGTIQSGMTLHFQMWHREAAGQSNFSNGVSVQF